MSDQLQYVLARAALKQAADKFFRSTFSLSSEAEWEEAFEKWIAVSEYVDKLRKERLANGDTLRPA